MKSIMRELGHNSSTSNNKFFYSDCSTVTVGRPLSHIHLFKCVYEVRGFPKLVSCSERITTAGWNNAQKRLLHASIDWPRFGQQQRWKKQLYFGINDGTIYFLSRQSHMQTKNKWRNSDKKPIGLYVFFCGVNVWKMAQQRKPGRIMIIGQSSFCFVSKLWLWNESRQILTPTYAHWA